MEDNKQGGYINYELRIYISVKNNVWFSEGKQLKIPLSLVLCESRNDEAIRFLGFSGLLHFVVQLYSKAESLVINSTG
jgi:hypothetical protein